MIDLERSTGVCTNCLERKPLSEFVRRRARKHGVGSRCRNCEAARNRAYRHRNPEKEKVRVKAAKTGLRDRSAEMPEFDLTKPISYQSAHNRIAYWRGRASIHVCPCGAPAQSWAYMHNCPHELIGDGGGKVRECRYSPNPLAYVALCRGCHLAFDLHQSAARRWGQTSPMAPRAEMAAL